MSRVLFVTKFAPSDRPSGGMLRTTRMLDALAGTLRPRDAGLRRRRATKATVSAVQRRPVVPDGHPVSDGPYDTAWLRAQIDDRMRTFRPDAIHVDYLAPGSRGVGSAGERALDLHNVESSVIGRHRGPFGGSRN